MKITRKREEVLCNCNGASVHCRLAALAVSVPITTLAARLAHWILCLGSCALDPLLGEGALGSWLCKFVSLSVFSGFGGLSIVTREVRRYMVNATTSLSMERALSFPHSVKRPGKLPVGMYFFTF